VGVFIFANALIVLCGVTGLFARLMKIIPHSLAAAMLAGILLRFGMQAFASLQDICCCAAACSPPGYCKGLASPLRGGGRAAGRRRGGRFSGR
jgi:benzoate membrane transport protein